MPLPSSGAISLNDVQTEFGGTNPIGINEYYSAADGVPASGTISLADFYGKSAGPAPGQLFVWGYNFIGELGINNYDNKLTPVTTFAGGTNWTQVVRSGPTTTAIKSDGTLWTWGYGYYGQTGNNRTYSITPTTTFAGGTNWKQISGSGYHISAVKTDGTLWIWGYNNRGQLGVDDLAFRLTPVTTFAGGNNWKQVSCGESHTLAIKTDGTLWTWGFNYNGQLGINEISNRLTPVTTLYGGTNWKQVSGGNIHSAAIKTDGTLWTWGYNNRGQLGTNDTDDRLYPFTTFSGGTNWAYVSGKFRGTTAIKTDGTLWSWGYGSYGQLGTNATDDSLTPVTTFSGGTNWTKTDTGPRCTSSVAIKSDGTLWVWGAATNLELGINAYGPNKLTPVTTFAGGTTWKQVHSGNTRTAGIK